MDAAIDAMVPYGVSMFYESAAHWHLPLTPATTEAIGGSDLVMAGLRAMRHH